MKDKLFNNIDEAIEALKEGQELYAMLWKEGVRVICKIKLLEPTLDSKKIKYLIQGAFAKHYPNRSAFYTNYKPLMTGVVDRLIVRVADFKFINYGSENK